MEAIQMKKVFAAAVLMALVSTASTAAFAGSCPRDMKQIDAALAGQTKLDASQLAEVTKLRSEGEALHKAGKHKESVETLHKAKAILGIK
jgi:hypothetical protein